MWAKDGGGPGLKTQIALFMIHHPHFNLKPESGGIAAGVENLIEVLRKSCVWLACGGHSQRMF